MRPGPGGAAAVASALLSLAGPAPAQASGEPDVIAYDVALTIDRSQAEVRGTERIQLRANGGPLAAVVFPRNGLQVRAVRLAGGAPVTHWLTADTIEIALPRPLAPGRTLDLELHYLARSPQGVRFRPDHLYTAYFTCHWMICREQPDDRATLRLAITVPDGDTLIASGTRTQRRRLADGQVQEVWQQRRPYPAYLYGFAIGRFARVTERHGRTPLEHFAVGDGADLPRLLADTGAMVQFFERRAGLPLPARPYRQVVVDGAEAQEATSFSLLGRQHLEPRSTTPEDDWVIAHELAHQFWGNLVTCADWTHFWLNEGLTVFMVAAWKEHRWGRAAYDRELDLARKRLATATAAGFDLPLTFPGRYPTLGLRRAVVYSKGALFMAALRDAMGEPAFWAALRAYTRRFAGHSVTSADVQRSFAAHSPVDLAPLFEKWVFGPA